MSYPLRVLRVPHPAGTHLLTPILLEAIREAGLSIPEDLSFVTYGGSAWASAQRPPISVIRYYYYGEAGIHVERLVARIEGWGSVPPAPIIPSQFVDRGSCGPAPGSATHLGAADTSALSAAPGGFRNACASRRRSAALYEIDCVIC